MTLLQSDPLENKGNKFRQFSNKIIGLVKNKWIRVALSVLTVGFATYYVAGQFANLRALLSKQSPSVGLLMLSSLFIVMAVFVGILTWAWILKGFGINLSWISATRIHLASILAKYIPGLVWQFSGKAYLAQDAGIPVPIALLAMGMEVGISLIGGVGLTLLLAPLLQFTRISLDATLVQVLEIIGLALLALLLFSPFFARRLLLNQMIKHKAIFRLHYWFMAILTMFLGWGLLAGAFFISAMAFGFDGLGFFSSLLTVCGSTTIGILVIFVPNGLVVREAVIMELLPVSFDQTAALLLSVIARLQVVLSELLVIGGFVGFIFFQKKVDNHIH